MIRKVCSAFLAGKRVARWRGDHVQQKPESAK
jgi:hypothetical protein